MAGSVSSVEGMSTLNWARLKALTGTFSMQTHTDGFVITQSPYSTPFAARKIKMARRLNDTSYSTHA